MRKKTADISKYRKEYWKTNRERLTRYNKEYRKTHPPTYKRKGWSLLSTEQRRLNQLLNQIKQRAKKNGLSFDIEASDIVIPERCPVLGIEITLTNNKAMDNSVSVDRIDPSQGYVKGNVIVVSWRANRLKSDASLEEMKRLFDFYNSLITKGYYPDNIQEE